MHNYRVDLSGEMAANNNNVIREESGEIVNRGKRQMQRRWIWYEIVNKTICINSSLSVCIVWVWIAIHNWHADYYDLIMETNKRLIVSTSNLHNCPICQSMFLWYKQKNGPHSVIMCVRSTYYVHTFVRNSAIGFKLCDNLEIICNVHVNLHKPHLLSLVLLKKKKSWTKNKKKNMNHECFYGTST